MREELPHACSISTLPTTSFFMVSPISSFVSYAAPLPSSFSLLIKAQSKYYCFSEGDVTVFEEWLKICPPSDWIALMNTHEFPITLFVKPSLYLINDLLTESQGFDPFYGTFWNQWQNDRLLSYEDLITFIENLKAEERQHIQYCDLRHPGLTAAYMGGDYTPAPTIDKDEFLKRLGKLLPTHCKVLLND